MNISKGNICSGTASALASSPFWMLWILLEETETIRRGEDGLYRRMHLHFRPSFLLSCRKKCLGYVAQKTRTRTMTCNSRRHQGHESSWFLFERGKQSRGNQIKITKWVEEENKTKSTMTIMAETKVTRSNDRRDGVKRHLHLATQLNGPPTRHRRSRHLPYLPVSFITNYNNNYIETSIINLSDLIGTDTSGNHPFTIGLKRLYFSVAVQVD